MTEKTRKKIGMGVAARNSPTVGVQSTRWTGPARLAHRRQRAKPAAGNPDIAGTKRTFQVRSDEANGALRGTRGHRDAILLGRGTPSDHE